MGKKAKRRKREARAAEADARDVVDQAVAQAMAPIAAQVDRRDRALKSQAAMLRKMAG